MEFSSTERLQGASLPDNGLRAEKRFLPDKTGQAAERRYCFKVKRVQWAVPAPSPHRFSARLSVTVWLWITVSGRKVRYVCQTPFFAARQTQFNLPAGISLPPAAFRCKSAKSFKLRFYHSRFFPSAVRPYRKLNIFAPCC